MATVQKPITLSESQKDHSLFYGQLGYCITRWAYVDQQLFLYFQRALGTQEKKAAIAYYFLNTFGGRLALTNEMLLGTYQRRPRVLKEWKAIKKKIVRLIGFRNIIAHQPAAQTGDPVVIQMRADGKPADLKLTGSKRWTEIRIGDNELLSGRRDSQSIKLGDLQKHTMEVGELLKEMYAFGRLVGTKGNEGPRRKKSKP